MLKSKIVRLIIDIVSPGFQGRESRRPSTAAPHSGAKGCGMSVGELIDNLIEMGRRVVDSDFDPEAFHQWRRSALDCLNVMLGPDDPYTQYFAEFVQRPTNRNLLAGGGVLVAAQQRVANAGVENSTNKIFLGPPMSETGRPAASSCN
jgi:hypothetical protein